jgi:hypothetical protein
MTWLTELTRNQIIDGSLIQPRKALSNCVTKALGAASILSIISGCASTQLNYNTLDLATTADHLLTGQIFYNLAKFIDSDAAIPGQVVINGGTATTANTVSPTFTDPFSRAVTLLTGVVTGAKGALTSESQSISAVTSAKTAALSASNVATQNWAFDPVSDPDQLRRLFALYRFAVAGNNNEDAQATLAREYPLSYKTTGTTTQTTVVDDLSLKGPNCVVCTTNVSNEVTPCKVQPNAYQRDDEKSLCVFINHRLLPLKDPVTRNLGGPWLKWKHLPTAMRPDSNPPPSNGDIFEGQFGSYLIYVDRWQADRFAQFQLFVDVAANSSQNLSSAGAGAGQQKTKSAIAVPAGIILP